ncbi:MAG TPA: hypothetical protein PK170_02735 [Anaerolineae bacterium]|nr:hypothetical protein [Anaerolineae bacterium]
MKAYTATCTRRILVAMVMGLLLVLVGSVRSTAESENRIFNQATDDRLPTGSIIVKSGRFCPSPDSLLPTYGTVDDAVRDTIPNEWENGYSNPYGQYIATSYPALKSAAIIFRTAIRHFEFYPDPEPGFNYRTYNVDVRAGQPTPPNCVGRMNTVHNSSGRYGGSPSFNSNQATTDTAGQYIVCAASSFGDRCLVETSPPIEASTVFCNEQSNGSDVGFCALQALYYGIIDTFPNGAGNKHVRRLNIQSSTSLTFEVESFDRRFDNVPAGNPHFWFCYRDTPVNWSGQCYLHAVPDNGLVTNHTNTPKIRYYIPFPVVDTSTRYGVWVRGCGAVGNPLNAVQIGLRNQPLFTAGGWQNCTQGWESRKLGTVTVSWNSNDPDGAYREFNIWMYDDGVKIDRVQLIRE